MSIQELTRPKEAETQVIEVEEKVIQEKKASFLEQTRQEAGEGHSSILFVS